jgi:apolipoprotein N-acyltransferase
MAFATNYRRIIAAILAIASTAILFWFGNGLNPIWPLMWIAPLPVLIFALRNSWRSAAITSALAMFLAGTNMWNYLHSALGAAAIAWISIYAVAALAFAASVLLFRALVLRGAPFSALLSLPAASVAIEFIRNLTTPHGTAGSLAYSQLNFLPFLQLASITGPWGMTFVLLLFPTALAIAIHLRHTAPKQALHIATTGVGITAAVLIFGAIRLAQPTPHQLVKVGLVTSDLPENDRIVKEGPDAQRLFHAYAAQAQILAAQGAQVIVFPEKLAVTVTPYTQAEDDIFQSVANNTGATIIAGALDVVAPFKYNQARIYQPNAPVATYDKEHMLPPFESNLKPGTTLALLRKPTQTWGVAICKDMDFANPSRRNGEAGVGLMLVPGWDFNIDRFWHGHIAVMRGVEDGFSVARSAKDGYLQITDDRGRVLAQTRSDSAPFATLLTEVPSTHQNTIYLLLGDWFAWLTLAIFAGTLIRLYQLRR